MTQSIIYFCSLLNMSLGIIYKLPQIKLLHSTKSTNGLSYYTVFCDCLTNMIFILYNSFHGNDITTYIDYFLFLFQSLTIALQSLHYDNFLVSNPIKLAIGSMILPLVFYSIYQIPVIMNYVIFICTFFSFSGKISQILKVVKSDDVGGVSLNTWLIAASTSFLKLIQVVVADVVDAKLVFHCIGSTFLCSCVCVLLKNRGAKFGLSKNKDD